MERQRRWRRRNDQSPVGAAHVPGSAASGALDLEAVDVGFATDADLAGRDLEGKAVFFNSADYQSRHSTISHGAVKRIGDKGAAAIFITLAPSLQLIDNPVPLEDLRRR